MQPAAAQGRDTTARRDSVPRADSLRADSVRARLQARLDSARQRDSLRRADTVKAAIAEAEIPVLADPAGGFHWTRKDMFETGALNVLDLLDRVPGVVGLRSNWIAQPMMAAYLGDMRRVRVYVDGFEIEELDPRTGRVPDLSQFPIWSLDDLVVERTASELRIHMRTWRVNRTTPFTRTDVYTGDQATNLYRGLLGRRYRHGEVLQLAGQQFSTTPGRNSESSDQLGFMSRIGIARARWTADAVVHRIGGSRGRTFAATNDTIPGTDYSRYDAYVRLAWRDSSRGWWAQTMAGASTLTYSPTSKTGAAVVDTGKSRSQYVLTGGYARGPLHASFTQRFLLGAARHVATPSARAAWETPLLTVTAVAEGRSLDSTRRFDIAAVVRPVNFLYLSAAASREQRLADSANGQSFARAEAGLRLKDVWLGVGALRRDGVELDPAIIVRNRTPLVRDSAANGLSATLRGRIWRALYVEAYGVRWSDTIGVYRPQYQVRSELYLSTSLLHRFPTGNFHVRAGVVHEYRSAMLWPDTAGTNLRVPGYRTISTVLQFKIVSAEIFWTYRNSFDERYPQIPGYQLPRLSSIYGVRWEFWN